MTNQSTQQSVGLFYLGGAGALISRLLPEKIYDFCVKPHIHYLDTSESELAFHRKDGTFYLFKGEESEKSGSGGVRSTKVDLVKEAMPAFMVEHPLYDINILVFSSSGASGAVIAQWLIHALLHEGKQVIVLISQAPSTFVRASNSLKTLLNFGKLAKRHNRSLVGSMYESANSFTQADTYLTQDLVVLLHFLSNQLVGVDASDIEVLLSPERLPDMGYQPDFYSLQLLFENQYGLDGSPLAIMTLSELGGVEDIGSGAPITYSGIVDAEAYKVVYASDNPPVLSLAVFDTDVPSWINSLSRRVDTMKQRLDVKKSTRVELPKALSLSANMDDMIV